MPDSINEGESRPSLADAINAVMADPSIIQGALEALKKSGVGFPQGDSHSPPPPEAAEEVKEEKTGEDSSLPVSQDTGELIRAISPMLSMLSSPPSRPQTPTNGADRRAALLVALRPYLSESRRDAIDYIVKISQVSDLIKKAGR